MRELAAERARAERAVENMDELRRVIAEALGEDGETWPDHGNASLAIAAAFVLIQTDRDRLRAAIEQALDTGWVGPRPTEILRAALEAST